MVFQSASLSMFYYIVHCVRSHIFDHHHHHCHCHSSQQIAFMIQKHLLNQQKQILWSNPKHLECQTANDSIEIDDNNKRSLTIHWNFCMNSTKKCDFLFFFSICSDIIELKDFEGSKEASNLSPNVVYYDQMNMKYRIKSRDCTQ